MLKRMISWFSPKPKQEVNQKANSYRKTYLVFANLKTNNRKHEVQMMSLLEELCGYTGLTTLKIRSRIEKQKYGVIYETDDEADAWRVHKRLWDEGYEVPQFGTNPAVDGLAE